MLSFINWNISPTIYTIRIGDFEFPISWYGLLFALGFLIGQQIVYYVFKKEGKSKTDVDSLTIYAIVATVIGARLGHYLFYEWQLLMTQPLRWSIDLITPPFAGLASHGATISFLFALYLYSRTKQGQPFLWVVDRVVIGVSLGGAFIRLGNLMNSEIYGGPTSLPWGFIFKNETNPDLLPLVPRHPTQIYEALFCLVLLAYTFLIWKYKRHIIPQGFITGSFMILLFTFRFLVEFLKNDQSDFEQSMLLNMGQILSLPAIIAGILILFISYRKQRNYAV